MLYQKKFIRRDQETNSSGTVRGSIPRAIQTGSVEPQSISDWLRGRRELFEAVVERYDGTELEARIAEAGREFEGIESLGQVGLDGNMMEHDWVNNPTGEEILNAIEERGVSSRGTVRSEASESSDLPDGLRGRRELFEAVVERYDGEELNARIEEAKRESDGIDRAGDVPQTSLDLFQSVDENPHETPFELWSP